MGSNGFVCACVRAMPTVLIISGVCSCILLDYFPVFKSCTMQVQHKWHFVQLSNYTATLAVKYHGSANSMERKGQSVVSLDAWANSAEIKVRKS